MPQIADNRFPCVMLLGGLSVNLNHLKKNVSGAFDTPNIKVDQMCDIWKNRSWSAVDAHNRFLFDFFPIWPLFSRKSDKNRGFLHISPLYIKVGQILGLSKMGHGS